jgi:hypothetical protein
MNSPEFETVRKRIELTKRQEAKHCFMAEYFLCARISEIISRKCPSDITTTPRGLTGKDVEQKVFMLGREKHDIVVFIVRAAKRDGKVRKWLARLVQF